MRKDSDTKTPAKKKAAALRAQSTAATATPVDVSAPPTPAKNGDVDAPSRRTPSPIRDEDDRAISPVSTASSASEPPLAQKIKLNGATHTKPGTPKVSAKGSMRPITPREKADLLSAKEDRKPSTPKVKAENGQEGSPPNSTRAANPTSEAASTTNAVSERFF